MKENGYLSKPEKKSWFSKSSSSSTTNDADIEDQSNEKSKRISTVVDEDVVVDDVLCFKV
jgi:hypothetical protein